MEPPSNTYIGPITDTRRWESFQPRPDDIIICTPPKCGTTWTQAICASLIHGVGHDLVVPEHSPWIDAIFEPIDNLLERLEAQTSRRFVKTHSPLDGITYDDHVTYLVVLRDPRDAFCSMLNHRDNMNDADLAFTIFPGSENPFDEFLNRPLESSAWDPVVGVIQPFPEKLLGLS